MELHKGKKMEFQNEKYWSNEWRKFTLHQRPEFGPCFCQIFTQCWVI